MIEDKNKISISQMQILMIFNVLGSSLLTFPRLVTTNSENSFFFSIIIGTIISFLFSLLIIYILTPSKEKSLNDFLSNNFGKIVAKIILILFLLKLIISASIALHSFVDMTKNVLLPKTNSGIILFIFLTLCFYLCYKEQSVRAKTSQVIFYIFLLYISFFIITSLFKLNTDNIPNILDVNLTNLTKGSLYTVLSFSNIIFFYFDFFYLDKKTPSNRKAIFNSTFVILLIGIVFLTVTIVATSIFSLNGLSFITYPAFDTMARLSISNTFITRNEAIVFNFWIFIIFSFISACIFYSHLLLSNIFNIKLFNNKLYLLFVCTLLFILQFVNINESILKLLDVYISIFLIAILPFLLLVKTNFMTNKNTALFFLIPILLSSCSDKIELENRRFVYEIFIDKNIDNFILTYDYISTNDSNEQTIISNETTNRTLLGAINDAYMLNENLLDFRQVKTVAISTELAKDSDMLLETLNLLAKNNQVGNNTLILTYDDDTSKYTRSNIKKSDSLSYYLTNFLQNNKNNYITSINFDIDSTLLNLRNDRALILPNVSVKDSFTINGSSIIYDFSYKDYIPLDITKGYALL